MYNLSFVKHGCFLVCEGNDAVLQKCFFTYHKISVAHRSLFLSETKVEHAACKLCTRRHFNVAGRREVIQVFSSLWREQCSSPELFFTYHKISVAPFAISVWNQSRGHRVWVNVHGDILLQLKEDMWWSVLS